MQDKSQCCQIRSPRIYFKCCRQLGLEPTSVSRGFQAYSLLQKTSGLVDSEFYSSWNMNFDFTMTCLLIDHFKYLLKLQQHQIKDKSTMKQEGGKK